MLVLHRPDALMEPEEVAEAFNQMCIRDRSCTVHSAGSVHDTVPDADGRRRISRYPAGCNLLHLPEAVYRKRGHIRHQGLNPYRTSLYEPISTQNKKRQDFLPVFFVL